MGASFLRKRRDLIRKLDRQVVDVQPPPGSAHSSGITTGRNNHGDGASRRHLVRQHIPTAIQRTPAEAPTLTSIGPSSPLSSAALSFAGRRADPSCPSRWHPKGYTL